MSAIKANEVSAVQAIGEALSYDACEIALIKGSLNDALRVACMIADMSAIESDPVSVRVDVDANANAATIKPGK